MGPMDRDLIMTHACFDEIVEYGLRPQLNLSDDGPWIVIESKSRRDPAGEVVQTGGLPTLGPALDWLGTLAKDHGGRLRLRPTGIFGRWGALMIDWRPEHPHAKRGPWPWQADWLA
jgi:hypothetical protein